MDIQQVRYFIRTYDLRSYTQAAKEFFTSRQALRHSIALLESQVGTPLFTPQGRTLVPTPAAHKLYGPMCAIQKSFDQLETCIEDIRYEQTHRLRIGMVSGIHDAYTPEEFYARQTSQGYIAKHSVLITESCERLREMLREGSLDTALIVGGSPTSDEFDSRRIREGQLYLMVHRDNPLASQASVDICDLMAHPFVSRGDGYDLHRMIMERCREAGFTPRIIYQSSATFDLVAQVNSNLGVAYSIAADVHYYNAPNVVCVPFADPSMRWYLLELVSRSRRIEARRDPYWDTSGTFPQPYAWTEPDFAAY